MELKQSKPKRKASGDRNLKLPLRSPKEIVAVFNGLAVVINDWSSMNYLYNKGCFGKGSFSKSEPNYHTKNDDIPKIVFEHQQKNHSNWNQCLEYKCPKKNFTSKNDYELSVSSVKKFLEFSFESSNKKSQESLDRCSGNEKNLGRELSFLEFHSVEKYQDDNFKGLVDEILQRRQGRTLSASFKPKNEVIILSPEPNIGASNVAAIDAKLADGFFLPEENLNLNWEESLYLKSVLRCLRIIDLDQKNLSGNELWEKFKAADKNFVGRYVTYHYFRSRGWVIRSGMKFGGDYLLYKAGPSCYHSSYLIKVLKEKKISWRELIVFNRLAETFNKEVVLVKVLPRAGRVNAAFPELLEKYEVDATRLSRWFPSKERKPQFSSKKI